jgi:hypothetical protein
MEIQTLHKYSKSGTVVEFAWVQVYGDAIVPSLPAKIDPRETEHYGIHYRAKE